MPPLCPQGDFSSSTLPANFKNETLESRFVELGSFWNSCFLTIHPWSVRDPRLRVGWTEVVHYILLDNIRVQCRVWGWSVGLVHTWVTIVAFFTKMFSLHYGVLAYYHQRKLFLYFFSPKEQACSPTISNTECLESSTLDKNVYHMQQNDWLVVVG